MTKPNIVVIYSYYEKNDEYIKNLEFFLKNGIYDDIDYVFCINGHECSLDIPKQSNIRTIYRDNVNYDFGAYDDAMKQINISTYDYYFLINTSVRGPFLPGKDRASMRWTEPFLKLLTGDVKLVGTTINILNVNDPSELNKAPINILTNRGLKPPFAHIQSQVLLFDREALQYLISQQFFDQPVISDFMTFVMLREVMISQLILKKGWNINCLLPKYQGLDYRTIKDDINPTSVNGDPYYTGAYFGGNIRPYDVIFIKTNRGVSTDEIVKLTDQYFIYNKNKTDYIEPFIGDRRYINTIKSNRYYTPERFINHLIFSAIFLTIAIIVFLIKDHIIPYFYNKTRKHRSKK